METGTESKNVQQPANEATKTMKNAKSAACSSKQPIQNDETGEGQNIPTAFNETIRLLLDACSRTAIECGRTSAIERIESLLMKQDIYGLTVIGNTGDGKTVAAKTVAWNLYRCQGFIPVEVRSIPDITESYRPGQKTLFLVDDPFGAYRIYWEFVRDWATRQGELHKYLITGHVKILTTLRTHVWEESKLELKPGVPFDRVVDISSSLTTEDRRVILRRQLALKEIEADSWKWNWKVGRIANTGTTFGFPICCNLMVERINTFEDAVDFLEKPLSFMREELRRMADSRPYMYTALALVMLGNGQFTPADLDPGCRASSVEVHGRLRDLLSVCGIGVFSVEDTLAQIRRTLNILKGTFLLQRNDKYEFTDHSLIEAVALEFGRLSPRILFKYAQPELVVKTMGSRGSDLNLQVVAIEHDLYPDLATILNREWVMGHTELAFSNPSWHDPEFQATWERCALSGDNGNDFSLVLGNRWQRTVANYAARKGFTGMVKFLYKHSPVDIKILKDQAGVTMLHSAASGGHEEVVSFLLKIGFDPNVQEQAGWTPLYTAVLSGHERVVRLLLSAGADPNICTPYGSSPMFLTALCQQWAMIPLLRSWGARPIEIPRHSHSGLDDLVSIIMDHDDSLTAALLRAARAGKMQTVLNLLDDGANVNETNAFGWTSLYVSVVCRRSDMASLLLHRGADPQKATTYGRKPTDVAKMCGYHDIVKLIDSFESGIISVN